MDSRSKQTILMRVGLLSALVALAAIGTMVIRIPVPATTGYFNIGDVFVIFAGLWMGPIGGLVVGAIGPTIADAIGFPQFMLATSVTKGLEGLVVGIVGGGARASSKRKLAGAIAGAVVLVSGYFVFEAWIYPSLGATIPFFAVTDFGAAVVEVIPNTAQGVIGAAGGLALWRAVRTAGAHEFDNAGGDAAFG